MVYAKTVCRSGSYVEVAPAGLRTKLQYNQYGILQCMIDPETDEVYSSEAFDALKQNVPGSIQLNGGTTFVEGVFFSTEIPCGSGSFQSVCEVYKKGYSGLTFYAGLVTSYAAAFKGALVVRNWLHLNGFNVLPGSVVPVDMTEDTLCNILSGSIDFKFPYISGYYAFEDLSCSFIDSGLKQAVVTSVSRQLDQSGYVMATLRCGDSSIVLNYSDIVTFQIKTNSCILYYNNPEAVVLDSRSSDDKKRDKVPEDFTCPVCGKKYRVPKSGVVHCDDPNCMSVQYPNVAHMLNVLGLPELLYKDFMSAVKESHIICLPDILDLPQYKETRIQCSLACAIECIVPVTVCADTTAFSRFANKCDNEVATVLYYITNPYRIATDLIIDSWSVRAFLDWFIDPANISTFKSLLGRVEIAEVNKKFEGAPIFRNRVIAITGTFRHGSLDTIKSILESYAATVTLDPNDNFDCLVVGDMQEGNNGLFLIKCRTTGIPQYTESDFFIEFDIDADLSANLL